MKVSRQEDTNRIGCFRPVRLSHIRRRTRVEVRSGALGWHCLHCNFLIHVAKHRF